ncbi:MAG: type II toxin-antitoxin system VapC family toxin [Desulfobacterales bacterium]|nr:type II toxin-antitoxin system VapC family toxin [Desulfobacterales bacterium]
MIVVDTNIIGYLFLSNVQSPSAERTLTIDNDWAAPLLWRSELRNVLALYMRKKLLALAQANQIMNEALKLMRGREFEVSSYEVLRLASESRCTAYDCEFIALANDLKVPLVTVDKALLRGFPSVAVSLKLFCERFGHS